MKVLEHNIITATDSYKVGHWLMYPASMSLMRAYFEARKGARYDFVVFFGLQYILESYFEGVQVTTEKIDKAEVRWNKHLGRPDAFNRAGWERIRDVHNGMLPIRIRAVKEGSVVPIDNALIVVESTDPELAWLTNYVETIITHVWYGCTVATRSKYIKSVILEALEKSGDPGLIQFKLHDFGYRGVSSREQAMVGGAAHLINFWGTDTHVAIEMLEEFYGPDFGGTGWPGHSIIASEHSTVTSWGQTKEADMVKNYLEKFPDGLIACVGDSYDMEDFVRSICGTINREAILKRDGVFVIRPDSGDPHTLLPALMEIAYRDFGGNRNSKGYRVINDKVRFIQGDGIDDTTVGTILKAIMDAGFSADNLAFGSGGGLLQKIDRDTQRFAFKCSQVVIDGVEQDVYKQPKTDMTKCSKKGNLKLIKTACGQFKTVRMEEPGEDLLEVVFDNGHVLRKQTLAEIRALAA